MTADQFICIGIDNPVFNRNVGTKCCKSLDMLVYRPESDITSARQNHLCMTVFAQKCSDQII